MTIPASESRATGNETPPASRWPAILTWRAHNASRMESVRVTLNGNRIRAAGRMIGGAWDDHPAVSAAYDQGTVESGATKR
ncbi:putative glycolipid-binding domain-containing protein, partial [Nocardia brasiliensis]|uniref:putative glycolipid-binding domain-containing protein n=1 Tax=Nocardia brasiliensis TaxID=37326 RepID=UPI002455AB5B